MNPECQQVQALHERRDGLGPRSSVKEQQVLEDQGGIISLCQRFDICHRLSTDVHRVESFFLAGLSACHDAGGKLGSVCHLPQRSVTQVRLTCSGQVSGIHFEDFAKQPNHPVNRGVVLVLGLLDRVGVFLQFDRIPVLPRRQTVTHEVFSHHFEHLPPVDDAHDPGGQDGDCRVAPDPGDAVGDRDVDEIVLAEARQDDLLEISPHLQVFNFCSIKH